MPNPKLVDWLEAKGYTVEPARSYACYPDDKVTYRQQDSAQTQLFGLLHECGHVLISEACKRPSAAPRFKRGYPSGRAGRQRSNVSAADLVHEEIEAWYRGYMLARRLGIRLNSEAYWRDYGQCIKNYFRKALRRCV